MEEVQVKLVLHVGGRKEEVNFLTLLMGAFESVDNSYNVVHIVMMTELVIF